MSERKTEAQWIETRRRWQIKIQVDGKRKTFTSYTPGRKGKVEAERKADRWLEDPASAERARAETLLDQYADYLKETKSTGHYTQYAGFIRLYIKPVIGHIRMNRLTEGDLQDVIDLTFARRKLSEKTLRDVRGCMLNWLKWCRRHGKTSLHPESIAIPAGARRTEKKVVQPEGIVKLFSVSTTQWRGKVVEDWYIHAYRFAVLTGLRPGELRGLEDRADVRGDRVTIRRSVNIRDEVTQGKNKNANRTFQLTAQAQAVVADQRAMLRQEGILSPYLFPDQDGQCMNHQNFYRAWGRYCEANGIPKVSLYELRHTYVSVNKEMPAGLKKMVVGHSKDMDTDGVYGHQMAGDLAKAANYTEQAFGEIIGKK